VYVNHAEIGVIFLRIIKHPLWKKCEDDVKLKKENYIKKVEKEV
jgi:hypothetical protein